MIRAWGPIARASLLVVMTGWGGILASLGGLVLAIDIALTYSP